MITYPFSAHASPNRSKTQAVLKFDITTRNDQFIAAIHAMDYWHALWTFRDELRQKVKYGENQTTTWEEVQDLFYSVLNEERVDLDEIA